MNREFARIRRADYSAERGLRQAWRGSSGASRDCSWGMSEELWRTESAADDASVWLGLHFGRPRKELDDKDEAKDMTPRPSMGLAYILVPAVPTNSLMVFTEPQLFFQGL